MEIAPLGHSWPSLHWWLSLTAADQGSWISGIGSLAAAAVAVLIAGAERRHRHAHQRVQQALADYRICVQLEPVFQDLCQAGEHLLDELRTLAPGQKSELDLRQHLRLATFRAAAELNVVSENISRELAVNVLASIGLSRKIAASIESSITVLPPPPPPPATTDRVFGMLARIRGRHMASAFSQDPEVRDSLWHDAQVLVYHSDRALIRMRATIGFQADMPKFEGPPSLDLPAEVPAPSVPSDAE
ncbi:hypothetical protein [Frateuria terrea]|uniref:Uncharacterized protein n=1 Tax=Frateuria terrea TaxID=529704 RepID=A0A1H6ULE5_9GAMM|nr:hypothetical protein [Frateuria terrea]SEI92506.1 hypothetical protein SAMN04487997_2057 [Frateuria terrea]SFP35288.1 hypothetical protein SAMN02927913_1670 [Frateuria terrea]